MICGRSRAALCAAGMLFLPFGRASAQETPVVVRPIETRIVSVVQDARPVQPALQIVPAVVEVEVADIARQLVASTVVAQPPRADQTRPPSGRPPVSVPKPAEQRRSTPNHQGFSVVLVLADLKASTAQGDVPPAAQRALEDMKDFLPYKSYRLLDAAWVLGQGQQTIRLRGPEGHDYELRLSTHAYGQSSGRVPVQFSLREVDSQHEAEVAAVVAETADARAREQLRERLQRDLEQSREKRDETRAQAIEEQLAEMERHSRTTSVRRKAAGNRPIIDTTFTMEVGETVVVGTSRLRENSSALIALLTAVPPRSSSPRETGR